MTERCDDLIFNAEDGGHDWVDGYYGVTCSKCGAFHAYGNEPWTIPEEEEVVFYGQDPATA